ncbi:MAG: ABC transporter permease [Ardenticatenaceae bacterium]|nr:ABC transporter permease [Ardenticatenaceae bacterium]
MTSLKQITHHPPGYWRRVLILASKDIVDAFKNKTILTIFLGLSFMILSVQALPLLLQIDDRPTVAIYDPARTRVSDLLRREGMVQINELRRETQLLDVARSTSGTLLAVNLTENWPETSGPLTVEGYIAHWIPPETAAAAKRQAETALAEVIGRPVEITVQQVYPTPESGGHTIMMGLGFVIAVTMVTSIVVPSLLIEEKTAHTLEMLRVSPLTEGQIVLGKGTAGFVFGLVAAVTLLLFNWRMVRFWDVMIMAVAAGTLFGVSLGLLMGMLVKDESAMQQWIGLLSVLLLAPLMTVFVDSSRLPDWLMQLIERLPPVALFELVRMALYEERLLAETLANCGLILAPSALLLGFVIWQLQRWEVA